MPLPDAPPPKVTFQVTGSDLSAMVEDARKSASTILQVSPDVLVIYYLSDLTVEDWSRFEKPVRPTKWSITITLGVLPEKDEPEAPVSPVLTLIPKDDDA